MFRGTDVETDDDTEDDNSEDAGKDNEGVGDQTNQSWRKAPATAIANVMKTSTKLSPQR